ncbi:MAG: hypothetical protein JWO50_591 [Candidatus Kaiserbacteria bacterium]|nr:hypothetical protein [Candidatus Kaiserbacteria bacterium]
MKLTTQDLQRYKGGQLEVRNEGEDYLYRGEIAAVEVTEGKPVPGFPSDNCGDLNITLKWVAKMEDGGEWNVSDRLDYSASLLIYNVSDAEEGRLFLLSPISGEAVTLFPQGGSTLDPSRIVGLNISE